MRRHRIQARKVRFGLFAARYRDYSACAERYVAQTGRPDALRPDRCSAQELVLVQVEQV